jgi:hypothetical protein
MLRAGVRAIDTPTASLTAQLHVRAFGPHRGARVQVAGREVDRAADGEGAGAAAGPVQETRWKAPAHLGR